MSNTTAPDKIQPDADEQKVAKRQQDEQEAPKSRKEQLISDVSKWYGVEAKEDGDLMQFVKDANKAALENAKVHQVGDPQQEAIMSAKIGELRQLAEGDTKQAKLSPDQQGIRDALDKADMKDVSVTFPDDTTYVLRARGKETTGNSTNPVDAIVADAVTLKGDMLSA